MDSSSFATFQEAYHGYSVLYSNVLASVNSIGPKSRPDFQITQPSDTLVKDIKAHFKTNDPLKNPFIIFNRWFPISYRNAIKEIMEDKTFISKEGAIFIYGCKQFDLPKDLVRYILNLYSSLPRATCDKFQEDLWFKMTLENPKLLIPRSNKKTKKIFEQLSFVEKPKNQEKKSKIKFWK